MSRVVLAGVSKRYGDFWAVRDFSLEIEQGELVVLLGPSGCGKTTILRMIAGLVEATTGRIRLGRRSLVPPYRRNTGLVFQGYALPAPERGGEHRLRASRCGSSTAGDRAKVVEALRLVRWRAPAAWPLSGGQQQQVALARALVIEPGLLPRRPPRTSTLSSERVRVEIRQLQRKLGLAT
jgi:putative spermidine/putrescine transport system ATP-binding protein